MFYITLPFLVEMYFYKEQNSKIYIGNYQDIFITEKENADFNYILKQYEWVSQDIFFCLKTDKIGVLRITSCDFDIKTFILDTDLKNNNLYYIIDFFDITLIMSCKKINKLEYILYWYKKSQPMYLCKEIDSNEGRIIYQNYGFDKVIKLLLKNKSDDKIVYYDKFKKCIIKNSFDLCDVSRHFNRKREMLLKVTNTKLKKKEIEFGRFSPIISIQRKTKIKQLVKVYESITNGGNGVYFDTQSGKGLSVNRAAKSAIGEAMERFFAMQFPNDEVICKSYIELVHEYKEIDVFVNKIGEDWEKKVKQWIFAFNIKKNTPCLIEAERVFFPYQNSSIENTTTGLSAGASLYTAVENAILEIVERDAYSITFRANKRTRLISDEYINKKNKYIINRLKMEGIKCHLVLLYSDIPVYIVHCMFDDTSDRFPKYTHGSCARYDLNEAVEGAICECAQLRLSQLDLKNNNLLALPENKAYFEWGVGNLDYCSAFLDRCGVSDMVGREKCIKNMSELLEKINDDVICVDLSVENCNLKVVKVIIPSFQDIYNGSELVTKRLKSALGDNKINRRVLFT